MAYYDHFTLASHHKQLVDDVDELLDEIGDRFGMIFPPTSQRTLGRFRTSTLVSIVIQGRTDLTETRNPNCHPTRNVARVDRKWSGGKSVACAKMIGT